MVMANQDVTRQAFFGNVFFVAKTFFLLTAPVLNDELSKLPASYNKATRPHHYEFMMKKSYNKFSIKTSPYEDVETFKLIHLYH